MTSTNDYFSQVQGQQCRTLVVEIPLVLAIKARITIAQIVILGGRNKITSQREESKALESAQNAMKVSRREAKNDPDSLSSIVFFVR